MIGMTPALHPSHLERYVFAKFSIPVTETESLRDQLLAFVKAAQATSAG